ncbi:hypothetical protein QBC39DRAFT_71416 [Podospora conica]|nr:hypothetical protein QBC39DRAFT_71416 [Schizothecium conicum]
MYLLEVFEARNRPPKSVTSRSHSTPIIGGGRRAFAAGARWRRAGLGRGEGCGCYPYGVGCNLPDFTVPRTRMGPCVGLACPGDIASSKIFSWGSLTHSRAASHSCHGDAMRCGPVSLCFFFFLTNFLGRCRGGTMSASARTDTGGDRRRLKSGLLRSSVLSRPASDGDLLPGCALAMLLVEVSKPARTRHTHSQQCFHQPVGAAWTAGHGMPRISAERVKTWNAKVWNHTFLPFLPPFAAGRDSVIGHDSEASLISAQWCLAVMSNGLWQRCSPPAFCMQAFRVTEDM